VSSGQASLSLSGEETGLTLSELSAQWRSYKHFFGNCVSSFWTGCRVEARVAELQQENLKLASRTPLPADPPKPAVARQKPTTASGRPCIPSTVHHTFHAVHVAHCTLEAALCAGNCITCITRLSLSSLPPYGVCMHSHAPQS